MIIIQRSDNKVNREGNQLNILVRLLTTIKLRHAEISDAIEETDSINSWTTFLILSSDKLLPFPPSSWPESSNNNTLRMKVPAYIKEVNVRGKTTACHCFKHKIAFQQSVTLSQSASHKRAELDNNHMQGIVACKKN